MAYRSLLVASLMATAAACSKAPAPDAVEHAPAVAPPAPALAAPEAAAAPLAPAASPAVAPALTVGSAKSIDLSARGEHFAVAWHFSQPKVGELFAVDIALTDLAGQPVPNATLKIDATMPAHGHGMMTDPELKPVAPTKWHAEGLKLHMHGAWQFEVKVEAGSVKERLTANYEQPPQATDGM
jgi:hypothetical protein